MHVQEIVEGARNMVFTPVVGPTESLRQLAAEYKALCERINDRLGRCGELLRKGYRSEAIRLAEMEPNLLDLASVADFPERDAFLELCTHFGLEVAPPLLLEIAGELNEAYAKEQSLEALLRQYRRYALRRVPLRRRIRVLRQLAQMDRANLFWQRDLEIFERERLREIQKELAEAAQARKLETIRALEEELTKAVWLQPPPESLIQSVQTLREEVSRQIARQELTELNRELHEAWEKFDVAEARRVRTAWYQMAELARLAEDDPLRQEAAPAFQWLEEEDQKEKEEEAYRKALTNLERALDREEKSLTKLRKLYREATRTDQDLPEYLQRAYQLHVAQLERVAKWRMVRNMTITLLTAVGVTLLAGWGLSTYRNYSQYRQTTQTLQNLLSFVEKTSDRLKVLRALQEAQSLVDQLEKDSPAYRKWSPLPTLIDRVKEEGEKELARQKQFQQWIAQNQKVLQNDLKELSRLDFDKAEEILKQAEQIALEEKEKNLLNDTRIQLHERKAEWQREKDRQFWEQINPLEEQLSNMEKPGATLTEIEIRARLESLRELAKQINQMAKDNPNISDTARTVLGGLREKCKYLQEHFGSKLQERQHEGRLVQLVGNHERFVQELKNYLQQNSGSPRQLPYERVLKEENYWKQLDQWNDWASQWNDSWENRCRLIKDEPWQQRLRQWTNFPGVQQIEAVRPYWEAIRSQPDSGHKRLQEILAIPPFQELWVLRHKENNEENFYYFLTPPKIAPLTPPESAPPGPRPIEYIGNYDLEPRRATLQFPQDPEQPTLAPHNRLCKELLQLLKETDTNNWEKNFCLMLYMVLTYTPPDGQIPIDPILRLRLLRDILLVAAKGSYPIKEGFSNWLVRLVTSPVNPSANWLDPKEAGYAERRRLALEFLRQFTEEEFKQNQQRAAQLWKQFQAHRLPEVRWVGVLQCDTLSQQSHIQWRIDLKHDQEHTKMEGNFYVVTAAGSEKSFRVVRIGENHQGVVQLSLTDPEAAVQGRPVFWFPKFPRPAEE